MPPMWAQSSIPWFGLKNWRAPR